MNRYLKHFTAHYAITTYICLIIKWKSSNEKLVKAIDELLPILKSLSVSVLICGFIINNFCDDFVKKIGAKRHHLILSDIFGHILPCILLFKYSPKTSSISPYVPLLLALFSVMFLYKLYINQYPGVPKPLITYVFPAIFLISYYYIYGWNSNINKY